MISQSQVFTGRGVTPEEALAQANEKLNKWLSAHKPSKVFSVSHDTLEVRSFPPSVATIILVCSP